MDSRTYFVLNIREYLGNAPLEEDLSGLISRQGRTTQLPGTNNSAYAARGRRSSLRLGMRKQEKTPGFLLRAKPLCRVRDEENQILRQEPIAVTEIDLGLWDCSIQI